MRTALHGWDQVDVAFCQQLAAFRQPQQRPVDRFRIAREVTEERFFRQRWQAVNRLSQIVVQTILIAPALFVKRETEKRGLSKKLSSGQKWTLVPVLRLPQVPIT
ncbi:hypothetical protein D3C85_1550750 [compost metagenome]